MIVMEYLPNGNLRDFLQKRKPTDGKPMDMAELKISEMIGMCSDIASGMTFLERAKFVHGFVCKIHTNFFTKRQNAAERNEVN